MQGDDDRGALFRKPVPNQHNRVTYAELFFDLVFVFAVTQISHSLLGRFTPLGALQTTLLFLAVWWVWIYTSWITNWLNPELTPVRILLFFLMLGGLVLSTSIPRAFEDRGLWFALAYAGMQVGRTVFFVASIPRSRAHSRLNAIRILAWLSASAVFWIAGGLAEGQSRLAFWAVALGIEYTSPAARFWIPKYGPSQMVDWVIEGGHMAERCAGFIIIALGESIVVTGTTFADLVWTADSVWAFASAFVGAIAMWWIYFHKGAEAGSEQISNSSEPGRMARLAYNYLHMPIVAGIILTAVADASGGPFRPEDGGERDRRPVTIFDRNDPVQVLFSWLVSTIAPRRHRRARPVGLPGRGIVAAAAVNPDHGNPDHGRSVGIDLAEIRRGRNSVGSHQRMNREHVRIVGP